MIIKIIIKYTILSDNSFFSANTIRRLPSHSVTKIENINLVMLVQHNHLKIATEEDDTLKTNTFLNYWFSESLY